MFVSPMLLHKSDHPFDDDDDSYITELKLSRPKLKKSLKNKEEHILVIYNMCSSFIPLKRPIAEKAADILSAAIH